MMSLVSTAFIVGGEAAAVGILAILEVNFILEFASISSKSVKSYLAPVYGSLFNGSLYDFWVIKFNPFLANIEFLLLLELAARTIFGFPKYPVDWLLDEP